MAELGAASRSLRLGSWEQHPDSSGPWMSREEYPDSSGAASSGAGSSIPCAWRCCGGARLKLRGRQSGQ
eukprot:448344-Alexandrium_andersonii.AAC.1